MTLREFYKRLQNHDWFYYFADDGGAFRRGEEADAHLRSEAVKLGGEFLELYDTYKAALFSGPSWGKPQLELPKLPE